jgi:putative tryptophan/tyrosine transport system substrate-binding protein
MKRREFITLIGGAAASPLAARAQQPRSTRKIGLLVNYLSGETEGQARIKAFSGALRKLGWIEGENLRTEIRYAGDEADRYHRYARELVEMLPDVIVAGASASVAALQGITTQRAGGFCGCDRPSWSRIRKESGSAKREYDRIYRV